MDPKIDTGGCAYPGFDEDGKPTLGQDLRTDIAKHLMGYLLTHYARNGICRDKAVRAADDAVLAADALIERLKR